MVYFGRKAIIGRKLHLPDPDRPSSVSEGRYRSVCNMWEGVPQDCSNIEEEDRFCKVCKTTAARRFARQPEVADGIRKGVDALKAGRITPWEEVEIG